MKQMCVDRLMILAHGDGFIFLIILTAFIILCVYVLICWYFTYVFK